MKIKLFPYIKSFLKGLSTREIPDDFKIKEFIAER